MGMPTRARKGRRSNRGLNEHPKIVMEYCGAGSVSDMMRLCKTTLTEAQIACVCKFALKVVFKGLVKEILLLLEDGPFERHHWICVCVPGTAEPDSVCCKLFAAAVAVCR